MKKFLCKDYLNSPAVKKVHGPEEGYHEKYVKSKVEAKKWLARF